jgi:hypothetical protein
MGLDMYAFAMKKKPEKEVDFDARLEECVEISYWRKHPNLHGWMEKLYREKGGEAESFNCVNVMLTEADLGRLERDVLNRELPETEGSFFGESSPEDMLDDIDFIECARRALSNGESVFYTSWW